MTWSVVLDIETVQPVDFRALRRRSGFRPWTDACWEHVLPAQVCAQRVDDDTGAVVDEFECVIRADDWYGIAHEFNNPYCRLDAATVSEGIAPADLFSGLLRISRGASRFIGYNIAFDMGVLRCHAAKAGSPLPDVPDVCLMDAAAAAMGQQKWPKLQEAFEALCGQTADESMTHDARYDVHMTVQVARATGYFSAAGTATDGAISPMSAMMP